MQIEDFFTKETHDAGAEVRLRDSGGNLTDCYLRVVGPDSDKWRDISGSMQRDALLNSFAGKDEKKNVNALRAEYLAGAVIDSRGFEGDVDDERLKALFIMAPYVADQVDKFIADRGNFTNPSAKN